MTPITHHQGKLVVRTNCDRPTPFLRSLNWHIDMLVHECRCKGQIPRAVDIGCGAGRQSRFLAKAGFEVLAFDRLPDFGYHIELENSPIPVFSKVANAVVLSYVLMFLENEARTKVISQAFSIASDQSIVVVELADVKNGNIHHVELVQLLDSIENMARSCLFKVILRRKYHLAVIRGFAQ